MKFVLALAAAWALSLCACGSKLVSACCPIRVAWECRDGETPLSVGYKLGEQTVILGLCAGCSAADVAGAAARGSAAVCGE